MILRRLRARASVYLSALLLLAGLALAAQATTPVTQSQMEAYFWERFAAGGSLLFAAVWTLLQSKTSRIEQSLDKQSEVLGHLKEALDGLIGEHKAIREQDEDLCAALRMRRGDGTPSRKRRDGDPPDFDGVRLRGRQ